MTNFFPAIVIVPIAVTGDGQMRLYILHSDKVITHRITDRFALKAGYQADKGPDKQDRLYMERYWTPESNSRGAINRYLTNILPFHSQALNVFCRNDFES